MELEIWADTPYWEVMRRLEDGRTYFRLHRRGWSRDWQVRVPRFIWPLVVTLKRLGLVDRPQNTA